MPTKTNKYKYSRRPKKTYHNPRKTKKTNLGSYLMLFVVGLVSLILLFVILLPAKYWDGKSRLALAIQNTDKSVKVTVFDPETNTINTFLIPAETEVEVSRNLGSWKIGSIWQLGINEKIGGRLLSETVTYALELPTEAWADKNAIGLTKSNSFVIWQSVFSSYKTNLNLKDKIKIAFFAHGVNNSSRNEIDLAKTQLLAQATLADGTKGYKVKNLNVTQISAYFADAQISKENLIVSIYHPINSSGKAEKLGEIIQVLGAKVTSLSEIEEGEEIKNLDCEVSGPKSITRKKIADIFGCSQKEGKEDKIIEVKIGEKFLKRF